MAVVENRFICDLSKPVQAQALKGNVFSLDNLGSRLSVLIYNNGQPATISGSVTANCILPDGSTVNVNGGLTTENGGSKAYVDIPQSCLLIPGILKIAIKCTSSSVITTLAAIVANVYMTKTDNVITPSQQIINDWNAEISAAIATQNAAIANQDTKINDLKSALSADHNSLKDAFVTNNLARLVDYEDGYLRQDGIGVNPASIGQGNVTSDYISVEGNSRKVYFSKVLRVGIYGSDKSPLVECVNPSPQTDAVITIGGNVKYIRFTVSEADHYNVVCSLSESAPNIITYDLKNSPVQDAIKQKSDSAYSFASKAAPHLFDFFSLFPNANTGIIDISQFATFEADKAIMSTGVANNTSWTTSDYIEINKLAGCEINYEANISTSAFPVAIFDSSKAFIVALPSVANNLKFKHVKIDPIISAYSGAKYIKIANQKNGSKVFLEYKPADIDAKIVNGIALAGTNTLDLSSLLVRKWEYVTSSGIVVAENTRFLSTPMLPVVNVLGTITYDGYFASGSAMPIACYDISGAFLKTIGHGSNIQNITVDIKAAYKEDPRIAYVRIYENTSQASGISITYTQGGGSTSGVVASMASQQDYAALGYARIAEPIYDYNIVICYGQSFSVGAGTVKESEYGPENCYMLGNYPHLITVGSANIASATLNRMYSAGHETNMVARPPVMYALTSFANRYKRYRSDEKKFVIISAGEGDQTVARLMDKRRYVSSSTGAYYFPNLTGGGYYETYLIPGLERVKALVDAESKTCGVIGVFFANGEADYGNDSQIAETTTAKCACNGNGQEWANRVLQLKADIEEDIGTIFGQTDKPAWFISQCCGSYGGSSQSALEGKWVRPSFGINKAQSIILPQEYGVFAISPDYQLPNVTDGHLTGNGFRWWGEYLADAFESVFLRNERPVTLRLKDARLLSDSVIGVSYYIPVAPIQFDTYTCHAMINQGFVVFVDGVQAQIDDVSIIDNAVYITLHNAVEEGEIVKLEYGTYYSYGTDSFEATIAGNLCDSSQNLGYLLGVEDLPRYKGSTVVPVEYTPVDKDGNTLEGKPFPMKNWCVAFSVQVN